MRQLLETLNNRVLPMVRQCAINVVAPGGARAAQTAEEDSAHFIEAYRPEHHTYFETMWLLSGQAHLKINDCVYTLNVGDLCFLPPLFSHSDVYNRQTPAYESLWFSCSPGVLSVNFFRYKPFGQSEALAYGEIHGWPEITSTLFALHREASTRDEYSSDAIHGLLLQLVVTLLRALEQTQLNGTTSAAHGRVAPYVLRFLQEHYDEEITLKGVAKVLQLSPNHMASVFKHETGQTVFEALKQIRVERASRLLLEEAMPVHAVARAVGFRNVEHFSRTFRRSKGIPPSRYGRSV